ncbi:hypothetical protein [Macrococcoides caseolyticum]|uniref:hypothetical protein n=1 Tax=Macrococcoides caseolyticum TaxID=69966 RepID=UPI001C5D34E3|nr:hypothetical protein [Macrococcus caseolyticus]QYA35953.1 hypothetical protein KYI08_03500 [Macrococcus caseolyticus]
MIKVGDYAKYKNDILIVKKTYMYSFVGISLTHGTKHILDYDNDVSWLVDYEDYEQQKQRADELEDVIKRYHDEALREIKRADELENTLAYIKSHLDNLWYNGDATEHEYAYNTLKYIESLQEGDNA